MLIVLSLKLILSVYPVKKRGTYDEGEGHPADFISSEQGIPLSRLTNGRPENGGFPKHHINHTYRMTQNSETEISPNFRAIKAPVGTMGSVSTASKFCRVSKVHRTLFIFEKKNNFGHLYYATQIVISL